MSSSHDDILIEKLQKTINEWSAEVTGAHITLSRQIGEAKAQLGTLISTLSSHDAGNGSTRISGAGTAGEVERPGDRAQVNIHELQIEIGALHGERTLLRAENEELTRLLQELQNDVEAGNTTLGCMRKELEDLKYGKVGATPKHDTLLLELNEKAADLQTAELEIDSLTSALDLLKNQTPQEGAAPLQPDDETLADLKTAELFLEDQMRAIREWDAAERARAFEPQELAENEQALNSELTEAKAAIEERDATIGSPEAERGTLREENDVLAGKEDAANSRAQSLQQALEESNETENELREQLNSITLEFERQADTLNETVKELEAHWKRAEDATSTESRLNQHIEALEAQVSEAVKSESQIESAKKSAKDELDELRTELLAFEEVLIEREKAVGEAAEKMKALEETAIAVQEQVSALLEEHQDQIGTVEVDKALAEADAEISRLKTTLSDIESERDTLGVRIQEQDKELANRQHHIEGVGAEKSEAQAVNEDIPHLLNEAMVEINALKEQLAQRDAEIAALDRGDTAQTGSPSRREISFIAHDDHGQRRSMGAILVDAGIINEKQLESALDEQRNAQKRRLGSILVEKGFVREEMVAQVVASQLNLPFIRIADQNIEQGAIALMDGRLATHHMCFPICATTETITVAMANPLDLIAIEDLGFATSLTVNPVVATLSDIASAIVKHYGVSIANAIAEDNFEHQTPPPLPRKSAAEKT